MFGYKHIGLLRFVPNGFRFLHKYRLLCRSYSEYLFCNTTLKMACEMSTDRTPGSNEEPPECQDQDQGVMSRIFQRSLNFDDMGYQLTLSSDETVATVRVPGLSVEAYDRDGNPAITNLMHIISSIRFFAYHKPIDKSGRTFRDYAKLTRDTLTFMASNEIEIDQAMYDKTVPKRPLEFTFQFGYVGNSSFNTIGVLTAPSTGKNVLRIISQLVYINKTTRRPMPLPDWWRGKLANVAIGNQALKVERTPRPAVTHVFPLTVLWSDTDNYDHATWTTYVQFCINAIHDGIRNSFYKNTTKDVVQKGLRKIRMGFIGENVEGDKLTVHSWENGEDNATVYCEIENAAGNVVFHASLLYSGLRGKI